MSRERHTGGESKEGVLQLDVHQAAERLMSSVGSPDRYADLYTIGKAEDRAFRPLVEEFLHSPHEPMLARLALQILVDWWGLAMDYRGQLLSFLRGVDWDLADGGYVQLVAISSAGEIARDGDDHEVLRELLRLYDTGSSDLVQGAAYAALARSFGKGWAEIPRPHSAAWRTKVDAKMLDNLRGVAGI